MDYGSFILSHHGSGGYRSTMEIMKHFFVLMSWEFYGMVGLILGTDNKDLKRPLEYFHFSFFTVIFPSSNRKIPRKYF